MPEHNTVRMPEKDLFADNYPRFWGQAPPSGGAGGAWVAFQAMWGRFGPPLKRYGGAFRGSISAGNPAFSGMEYSRPWVAPLFAFLGPPLFAYLRSWVAPLFVLGVHPAFLDLRALT